MKSYYHCSIILREFLSQLAKYPEGYTRHFDFSSYVTRNDDQDKLQKLRPSLEYTIQDFNEEYAYKLPRLIYDFYNYGLGEHCDFPSGQYFPNDLDDFIGDLMLRRPNAFGYCTMSYEDCPDDDRKLVAFYHGNTTVKLQVDHSSPESGFPLEAMIITEKEDGTVNHVRFQNGDLTMVKSWPGVPLKTRLAIIVMIRLFAKE